ncbi:MAG: LD-carboxypeptidase [Oscillospiraceae bacterium]|nr:LD-carboxypeptidase [Oscillospiraceae bacterium]
MQAKRMPPGGTIGIFCPSHVADTERYNAIAEAARRLGFKIKFGDNFYKDTYGYAASAKERAADLNALAADDSVHMILFSGGDGAAEILPLIDYGSIRRNPKLFSSYSDATSILNAVYSQTGLITYYGWGAGQFVDLRHYDFTQFCSHFIEGYEAKRFVSDSTWKTLCGGLCEGTLIGGYSSLFGLMLANKYFKYDRDTKYLLFLEDHEKFSEVGAVGTYLAFIGQSEFMRNVTGLIFGHYCAGVPKDLLCCLERFGAEHDIPVVYTDDFGHGTRHAVLPIGARAKLDADSQCMDFVKF